MLTFELGLWMLGAYLTAAIPMGLLIGLARGLDLREIGSGNIGTTNAIRAMGWAWGLLVFLLDVGKAALPVYAASVQLVGASAGPSVEGALACVGLAAVLGHVFPIYLGFRGGKGVACALGVFLVLAPKAALIGLALYLQTLVLTRSSALGSLSAVLVIVGVTWADASVPLAYLLLALAIAGLIWERHRDNLRELLSPHSRGAGPRSPLSE